MEAIIVAIITGGLTLIGVILTNQTTNKQMEQKLFTAQAVTDTKIENLIEEVRRLSKAGEEVPQMEVRLLEIERRVAKLEEVV